MRIDLYTKVVLTVIAVCLLCISFKLVFAPQPVVAAQCSNVIVDNTGLNAIPVRIVGIEKYSGYYRKIFEDGSSGKRLYTEPWDALPVVTKSK